MEESDKDWKGYVIVYSHRFYYVRNVNVYVGGAFTTLQKAREYIDRKIIADKTREEKREYNAMIRELKKEPDIGKRTRKYKQLCQAKQKLHSDHSSED